MKFLSIQTNGDLANLLKVGKASFLTGLAYSSKSHYTKLRIPKRTRGEYRDVYNPDAVLRRVQYALLKKIFNVMDVADCTYAFEEGKSVPQMASRHIGKSIVVSYDIRNYFPSIQASAIKAFLVEEGMGDLPATTISELCTYTYFVPQGALTSPKISNIIASRTFAVPLQEYCRGKNLTLTIYADDITISGETIPNLAQLHLMVKGVLFDSGFTLNRRKTKVMRSTQRQWVCGVVVNEKTNLLKAERRKLRAIVHNVGIHGAEIESQKMSLPPEEFKRHIGGRLNWFKQLNPSQASILSDSWKRALLIEADVTNNQDGDKAASNSYPEAVNST